MKTQPVVHSTFVLERSYPTPPERVFAAFADPAKKRRWFVERGGHQVDSYELDFRDGGQELACFRFPEGSPVGGLPCVNRFVYQNIVPGHRIVMAQSMTIGGNCISSALITAEFLPTDAGTNLVLTHQGAFFEGADGPEMREQGWRSLLERLAAECAPVHA